LSLAHASRDNSVSFTHLQRFDHDAVKRKLGNAVQSFGSFIEMGKVLQQQQMNTAQAHLFIAKLIAPMSQVKKEDAKVEDNRAYKKILALFDSESKGNSLVGHTKWGMLNACTEYVDHHSPARTNDARLDNAWFGSGEKLKNRAIELLLD